MKPHLPSVAARTISPRAAARLRVGLLAFTLLAAAAAAQTPPLYSRWINYTPANGFPRGEVYCVAIAGPRVWAGTEHGLALIENGRLRKVFTRADGLAAYAIMSLAVDPNTGDLWIGGLGGLSRYSAGKFINYTVLSSGLANDLVYSVAVRGKYVWAATAAGVSRLNTWTHSWRIFSVVGKPSAPFEEPWAYALAIGPKKAYIGLWGGGVVVYDLRRKTWRPYLDPDGAPEIVLYRNQGLISNMVSSLTHGAESNAFWAGTYFGLSGYDGARWHNYMRQDSGLASNFINGVALQGRRVWAATQRGLSEFDPGARVWVTYRPANWRALDAGKAARPQRGEILITGPGGHPRRLETATSLAHNYILNLAFQGNDIWVATAAGLSHGFAAPARRILYAHPNRVHRHPARAAYARQTRH